jgi:hypothetical protein
MAKSSSRIQRHLLCLDNEGYAASLERGKIYRRKPDAEAQSLGFWRVIDESGEDYLYPQKRFVAISLPRGASGLFKQRRPTPARRSATVR